MKIIHNSFTGINMFFRVKFVPVTLVSFLLVPQICLSLQKPPILFKDIDQTALETFGDGYISGAGGSVSSMWAYLTQFKEGSAGVHTITKPVVEEMNLLSTNCSLKFEMYIGDGGTNFGGFVAVNLGSSQECLLSANTPRAYSMCAGIGVKFVSSVAGTTAQLNLGTSVVGAVDGLASQLRGQWNQVELNFETFNNNLDHRQLTVKLDELPLFSPIPWSKELLQASDSSSEVGEWTKKINFVGNTCMSGSCMDNHIVRNINYICAKGNLAVLLAPPTPFPTPAPTTAPPTLAPTFAPTSHPTLSPTLPPTTKAPTNFPTPAPTTPAPTPQPIVETLPITPSPTTPKPTFPITPSPTTPKPTSVPTSMPIFLPVADVVAEEIPAPVTPIVSPEEIPESPTDTVSISEETPSPTSPGLSPEAISEPPTEAVPFSEDIPTLINPVSFPEEIPESPTEAVPISEEIATPESPALSPEEIAESPEAVGPGSEEIPPPVTPVLSPEEIPESAPPALTPHLFTDAPTDSPSEIPTPMPSQYWASFHEPKMNKKQELNDDAEVFDHSNSALSVVLTSPPLHEEVFSGQFPAVISTTAPVADELDREDTLAVVSTAAPSPDGILADGDYSSLSTSPPLLDQIVMETSAPVTDEFVVYDRSATTSPSNQDVFIGEDITVIVSTSPPIAGSYDNGDDKSATISTFAPFPSDSGEVEIPTVSTSAPSPLEHVKDDLSTEPPAVNFVMENDSGLISTSSPMPLEYSRDDEINVVSTATPAPVSDEVFPFSTGQPVVTPPATKRCTAENPWPLPFDQIKLANDAQRIGRFIHLTDSRPNQFGIGLIPPTVLQLVGFGEAAVNMTFKLTMSSSPVCRGVRFVLDYGTKPGCMYSVTDEEPSPPQYRLGFLKNALASLETVQSQMLDLPVVSGPSLSDCDGVSLALVSDPKSPGVFIAQPEALYYAGSESSFANKPYVTVRMEYTLSEGTQNMKFFLDGVPVTDRVPFALEDIVDGRRIIPRLTLAAATSNCPVAHHISEVSFETEKDVYCEDEDAVLNDDSGDQFGDYFIKLKRSEDSENSNLVNFLLSLGTTQINNAVVFVCFGVGILLIFVGIKRTSSRLPYSQV